MLAMRRARSRCRGLRTTRIAGRGWCARRAGSAWQCMARCFRPRRLSSADGVRRRVDAEWAVSRDQAEGARARPRALLDVA
jgi:hypothetical protein